MDQYSPQEFQKQVYRGFERTRNFRKVRMMFLRQIVGHYYDKSSGAVGTEPINLMYNAMRTIIPNIVMNFPTFNVDTQFVAFREYAELMGLALTFDSKQKNIQKLYRELIFDAILGPVGILKTGLGDSGTALTFDEWGETYDPGSVYTERVDFDDFVIDPTATSLENAGFLGDRIRVPRHALLESGLYDNALIERLPAADSQMNMRKRVQHLSARDIDPAEAARFMDEVEVVECLIPSANSIITVPYGDGGLSFSNYLRVHDYYGPDSPTGPYTFLEFGLPVPNNPFCAPPVGVWYDLHILANRLAKKTIDQAERQKTIVGYRRSAADDAQELLDAPDGEAVAMDDPEGLREFSFGGQQSSNVDMTGQLQMWFNMMAANPQGISGQSLDAGSATEANILQGNANIGLNDMKDLVYIAVAEEGAKRAWFFHTDPLINMPLTKRVQQQAIVDPMTGMTVEPASVRDVQVFLSPEARRGDWMDYTFNVQPESMGRIDSQVRLRQALDFAVKVLPSAAQSAQVMMMLGIPFNVSKFISRMAKEVGITWMDEVFFDPEFQMIMQQRMMMGPSPEGSQGVTGPGGMDAIMQNGQPANMPALPSIEEQERANQQAGAADAQADMSVREL